MGDGGNEEELALPVARARLWIGLLGGAAAWLAHLSASYALVPVVCRDLAPPLAFHLATVLAAGAALLAARVAWRARRQLRRRDDTAGRRARFMAGAGLALDLLFLLVIVAEGLPALVHDPCLRTGSGPLALLLPLGLAAWAAGGAGAALAHVVERTPEAAARGPDWNWPLLAPLLLAAILYARGVSALWRRAGRGRGVTGGQVALFAAGLAALFAALVSPVDELGAALFWAHMVQHMLLVLAAAPLLVLGTRPVVLFCALPFGLRLRAGALWRRRLRPVTGFLLRPAVAWLLHALALWLWHVPALYEAALAHEAVHLLEHASFLGTAILFWEVCARAGGRAGMGEGPAVLYVFTTAVQTGALGALITFAPTAWYPSHAAAASTLTTLEDQQLAGLVMWVPGGVLYTAAALVLFVRWVRRAESLARDEERRRAFPHPGPGEEVA